ncbi:MAG: CCA tRNA nucleotidyltransferase [Peptococcaceae bacterium]|nr:CCA tRNA nucleotidyltransferase [Peptococcaceae bacterium]
MNNLIEITIPPSVIEILQILTFNGFDAYVVGGCVRDYLLGLSVKDWDVATSASPQEVVDCFPHSRILDFGIEHNTLAILTPIGPVEITTYRTNHHKDPHPNDLQPNDTSPKYQWHDSPLRQDLRFRDFTINALAYHPKRGIYDPFGGLADLDQKILRGVSNPDARFCEDPLRILRALRFAATKNFYIEFSTRAAMLNRRDLLNRSAWERITSELMIFLTGHNLKSLFMSYRDIFAVILPEIVPSFDFEQKNPYHCFDVWRHTIESIDVVTAAAPWPLNAADVPFLKLTMLFHDLGKPSCWSLDNRGIGHFYGHAGVSAALATQALQRLKIDSKITDTISTLVQYHDTPITASLKEVLRWLRTLGIETFLLLLHVKKANILAQHPNCRGNLQELEHLYRIVLTVQEQNLCYTLRDLCINGNDLIAMGIPAGPHIGSLLESLLEKVMDGVCPNTHDALMAEVQRELPQG